MATPEQLARLAHVMGWLRTAKETLPALNYERHGRNAVTPEQIARASALLDRMHRRALDLAASMTAAPTLAVDKKVPAKRGSRRAA